MSRRCDAAGGLLEPRVQDARSWKLDKFIIIGVRILKQGAQTVRPGFSGWPNEARSLETRAIEIVSMLHGDGPGRKRIGQGDRCILRE